MRVMDWYSLFVRQIAQTDIIQWIVLVAGVSEVLLARANHVGLYAAGLISTVLSIYSLYNAQLYAESILNGYYVVMSIYGWWFWARRKDKPLLPVTFTSRKEWWFVVGVIVVGGWALLYVVLVFATPSTVPLWDSWISATAWAGTWLLTRRKVENWLVLNVSNAFAIPLLVQKELPLLAVLTLFLFVVACFGYVDWRRLALRVGTDRSSNVVL